MQVVEPKVRAYLYTWGEGRMTAEGEYIPVRVESLDVGYIDGMMCGPTQTLMSKVMRILVMESPHVSLHMGYTDRMTGCTFSCELSRPAL